MEKLNGIKNFNSTGGFENMSRCNECERKIGFFGSYRHPVYGGNKYVCGECFTAIDNSLQKWREFVISNSFNLENLNYKKDDFFTNITNLNNDMKNKVKSIISPGNII